MSNLRRYYATGQVYFTTHVTYRRAPILAGNELLLLDAFNRVRRRHSFLLLAWAIMPDHFHAILIPRYNDLSEIARRVKLSFSYRYKRIRADRRGRLWQYRFWDHVIRDDEDMRRHTQYIHFNPVKHGLVEDPAAYPWSSYHRFCEDGEGPVVKDVIAGQGEFGE